MSEWESERERVNKSEMQEVKILKTDERKKERKKRRTTF